MGRLLMRHLLMGRFESGTFREQDVLHMQRNDTVRIPRIQGMHENLNNWPS
jgi:hypothetical protein